MKTEIKKSGIFLRVEKEDWKYADVQGFLNAIKKLDADFMPVEKPEEEKWWRVGREHAQEVMQLKERYIERPKRSEKQLRDEEGYRPIPKVGGKFAYKRLRF